MSLPLNERVKDIGDAQLGTIFRNAINRAIRNLEQRRVEGPLDVTVTVRSVNDEKLCHVPVVLP